MAVFSGHVIHENYLAVFHILKHGQNIRIHGGRVIGGRVRARVRAVFQLWRIYDILQKQSNFQCGQTSQKQS